MTALLVAAAMFAAVGGTVAACRWIDRQDCAFANATDETTLQETA